MLALPSGSSGAIIRGDGGVARGGPHGGMALSRASREELMETLQGNPLLFGAVIIWAVITLLLIILMIFRAGLVRHEDDQVFIDPAEDRLAQEQRELVARIEKVSKPIRLLMILSGGMLLLIAGWFLYDVFQRLQ
jgi:hypothetical protein